MNAHFMRPEHLIAVKVHIFPLYRRHVTSTVCHAILTLLGGHLSNNVQTWYLFGSCTQ